MKMQKRVTAGLLVLMGLVCSGLFLGLVGRVRKEAERTQCINNLRQVNSAVLTYVDAYRRYPNVSTTLGHMGNVPLEKRMSWQYSIFAMLQSWMDSEYGTEYPKGLDRAWDSPENKLYLDLHMAVFLCPSNPDIGIEEGPGLTHYIGLTGLGHDAARLPATDKRAGLFSWERRTRPEDITDGPFATAMIAETLRDIGPWIAPGHPTSRGLKPDALPYLGGEGQFGSGHRSINLGMADASVRIVDPSIGAEVFEALVTIAGGEQVDLEAIPVHEFK
jgi:hypothetical protein